MAIELCVDDSASVIATELAEGTMRFDVNPADESLEIIPTGVRVNGGQGIGRDADGRPIWTAVPAAVLRTGMGMHVGATLANGLLTLQHLEGSVTNDSDEPRDILVQWSIAYIDIVEEDNPASNIISLWGIAQGDAGVGWIGELFHASTDLPGYEIRRVRMPANAFTQLFTMPPHATWTFVQHTTIEAVYADGSYTATIPGSRIDVYWLGAAA